LEKNKLNSLQCFEFRHIDIYPPSIIGPPIYTSADGNSWEGHFTPVSNGLLSIAWAGNRYFVVGENGTILTSEPEVQILYPDKSATHVPFSLIATSSVLRLTGVLFTSTNRVMVAIVAVNGKQLYSTIKTPSSSGMVELHISNLPAGVYCVKVTCRGIQFSQRFVKM
jgi:hypothetical protein